jgi:DNA-binding MarR family transcriptional regulator
VRLLQTYSKHCIATKTLTDVRLRAESEHRETEVGRRIPASAAQIRPEQVDELVRLYSELKSVKGLARHLGIHHHTVRKHLVDRGVEIKQPRRMTDDELTLATHLYIDEQLTAAQIALRVGFTASTIVKALNRTGVQMRPQVAQG